MTSGKFLFFNANLKGPKLEAAKKFAAYVSSAAVQERFISESQRLPALTSAAQGEALKQKPLLQDSLRALERGQPMPMEVEMRAVWDAIRPQLQRVMASRTEPKAAAQAMQRLAETRIREMKE